MGGNNWHLYLSETTETTWAKHVINIPCMNLCNVYVLDRAESMRPHRRDIVSLIKDTMGESQNVFLETTKLMIKYTLHMNDYLMIKLKIGVFGAVGIPK